MLLASHSTLKKKHYFNSRTFQGPRAKTVRSDHSARLTNVLGCAQNSNFYKEYSNIFKKCLKLIYFDLTSEIKKIANKHHNKYIHSLKFSNAFCGFHRRSAKKKIFQKNSRYSICRGYFLQKLSRESQNTPIRKLWRNGRLRVNTIF